MLRRKTFLPALVVIGLSIVNAAMPQSVSAAPAPQLDCYACLSQMIFCPQPGDLYFLDIACQSECGTTSFAIECDLDGGSICPNGSAVLCVG
jgi:hypothetical protein